MIENIAHGIGGWAQDRGVAKLDAMIARASGIKSPDQVLAELKANYTQAIETAEVNGAMYQGANAQVLALMEALKSVCPNHPLLLTSGQKYVDGKPKSKLRILFEAAFDNKLRVVGGYLGANPKAHRKN
jgi:hypothetical protein